MSKQYFEFKQIFKMTKSLSIHWCEKCLFIKKYYKKCYLTTHNY